MTIRLLTDWPYRRASNDGEVTIPAGNIVAVFDAATEAGMIDAKVADASAAAVTWTPPSDAPIYTDLLPAEVVAARALVSRAWIALPAASGSDDTATLNALLAQAANRRVRGMPGQTYRISSPLIGPPGGNFELDMTGCNIDLISGNAVNLFQSYGVTAASGVLTIANAATSSGAATVTSASNPFTSAHVGKSIVVTDGNGAGKPFCGVILTVDSAGQVTTNATAAVTATGKAATIFTRDEQITLRGGSWNRGAQGATGDNQHIIYIKRCDRVVCDGLRITSQAGKYALYIADATDVWVDGTWLDCASDGVHLQGPINGAIVRNTQGTSGDDAVAVGNTDYVYNSTFGDVFNVLIDGVSTVCLNSTAPVKLYGAAGNNGVLAAAGGADGSVMRHVTIKNVLCTGLTLRAVGTDIDGYMDHISIEGVKGAGAVTELINIKTPNMGTLKVTDAGISASSSANACVVSVANGAVVDSLLCDGLELNGSTVNNRAVTIQAGGTCNLLSIQRSTANSSSTAASMVRIDGTVTTCRISNCEASFGTSSGFVSLGTAGVCSDLMISGCYTTQSSSGSFVQAQNSGSTLGRVWLSNNVVAATAFTIADLATTTTVTVTNHRGASSNSLNLRATAVVILNGSGPLDLVGTASTTAGYSLRVNHPGYRIDASKITTQAEGDMVYNTNTSWASGSGTSKAGLYGYTGAAWTKIFGPA